MVVMRATQYRFCIFITYPSSSIHKYVPGRGVVGVPASKYNRNPLPTLELSELNLRYNVLAAELKAAGN